ncbi:class I glutamine amidotransferase-like protein [Annulohypoxylon truncatum]|uniref:class I glutamine amidotransferase-like protein n=1 Tax=Annulohypoxylon truncatum TaxID=327061 RepID=UPI0020088846|nr:class I glutamine amidotransferase-like protein [Annulohypoxylon truncatum]KAI1207543.1 class I glutamine amidotransferase-like protein [Annulohypoxylon truncatum]
MDRLEDPVITHPGMYVPTPKVLFMMADYGHDPTETAVPYTAFKEAKYDIKFATENGKPPRCDKKMLEGFTQKLLGAKKEVISQYKKMIISEEVRHPLAWSDPDFSLDPFDLVIFPGGHDKGVRQIIDSPIVHKLVVDYFPKTKKPSKKVVGAVCHGVMVLSESKDAAGRSVIRDCDTTALPAKFEQAAYWGTRAVLGDYYKTYGHGSENVEDSVKKVLADPAQFKAELNPGPFYVEDKQYNYISARYPVDAELFAEEIIKTIESFHKIA